MTIDAIVKAKASVGLTIDTIVKAKASIGLTIDSFVKPNGPIALLLVPAQEATARIARTIGSFVRRTGELLDVTATPSTGHDPIVRTAIALLGVLLGCGGQVTGGQDAGPSSTGPGQSQDGGSQQSQQETGTGPGMVGACPTSVPPPGTACASPSEQDCGYLNAGQPCILFACDSSGHWQQLPHCP